jgi:hypothetical protein
MGKRGADAIRRRLLVEAIHCGLNSKRGPGFDCVCCSCEGFVGLNSFGCREAAQHKVGRVATSWYRTDANPQTGDRLVSKLSKDVSKSLLAAG